MGFRSQEIGASHQITRYWSLVKIENKQTKSKLNNLSDLQRLKKIRFQPLLHFREPAAS
ncbi:MAG: hypothetical protein ACI8QW_001195 [Saprospiraceae bacterium]|jgi:hypothetical protein